MNREFIAYIIYLIIAYFISYLIPMFFIYGRKNVTDKEMDADYTFFKVARYIVFGFILIILLANLFNLC